MSFWRVRRYGISEIGMDLSTRSTRARPEFVSGVRVLSCDRTRSNETGVLVTRRSRFLLAVLWTPSPAQTQIRCRQMLMSRYS